MAMDDTDRQLISMLRKDARTNVAKLGISRSTVANRLRKLEGDQVIVGYTVRQHHPRGNGHERFVALVAQGSGRVQVEVSSCRVGVQRLLVDVA